MNSLLYSIRGFKVGDPAFTFDYESKGFDRSVWSKVESSPESDIDENDPSQYFEFIASSNGQNVNFFGTSSIPEDGSVYYKVNNVKQDNAINALNFGADDIVKICYGKNSFDSFSCNGPSWLREIVSGRIPTIRDTSFENCFYNNYALTTIPKDLFANNPQITSFQNCFYNCIGLTAVPAGLFDNNPNVISFKGCFKSSILTSIPEGLFDKNTQVTDFSDCFNFCINLTVNVQIGSTASSVNVSSFASRTKEKGTVYCREGSAAYIAFSESTNANVNVLTY